MIVKMDNYLGLALLLLITLLVLALLLRRPRVALAPEWLAQFKALEAAVQATQLAVARNDGALAAMDQQLRGFTHGTQALLDERLAQAGEQARSSQHAPQRPEVPQRIATAPIGTADAREQLNNPGIYYEGLTITGLKS